MEIESDNHLDHNYISYSIVAERLLNDMRREGNKWNTSCGIDLDTFQWEYDLAGGNRFVYR